MNRLPWPVQSATRAGTDSAPDHVPDPSSDCSTCAAGGDGDHQAWNMRARGETPTQRVDRGYLELLQEVRVAQTGVQIVLAFLLWLAYSPGFAARSASNPTLWVRARETNVSS